MNLWQKVKPYLLGGVGAGLLIAGILLGGECSAWRGDHPSPAKPVAQVLPPTPAELATPKITVPCVPVQALQPSPKRLKEIAAATGRPAAPPRPPAEGNASGSGEIVAPGASSQAAPDYPLLLVDARPYPPSPDGGTLWVWLEQDGSATVVAKPNMVKPAPADRFWSFRPVWELGGLYGFGQAGDVRGRAWGALEPLRAGRLHLRVEAGVDLRSGQSDAYALAGAVWRSR